MRTALCMMLFLGLAAISSQQLFCRRKDTECMRGLSQCCEDLVCKRKFSNSVTTTCQPEHDESSDESSSEEDEWCNRENSDCTPVIDPCCSGLRCERNMLGIYMCRF